MWRWTPERNHDLVPVEIQALVRSWHRLKRHGEATAIPRKGQERQVENRNRDNMSNGSEVWWVSRHSPSWLEWEKWVLRGQQDGGLSRANVGWALGYREHGVLKATKQKSKSSTWAPQLPRYPPRENQGYQIFVRCRLLSQGSPLYPPNYCLHFWARNTGTWT